MNIKKIFFCLIPIISESYLIYGMKRQYPLVSVYQSATKKPKIESLELLLVELEAAIARMDYNKVMTFLSMDIAHQLSETQKDNFYQQAIKIKNDLANKIKNASTVVTKTLYPQHDKSITSIIQLLYAYKVFPTFTFPLAFFSPKPYTYSTDPRQHLSHILEALIKNEQEKISICCFHLGLIKLGVALVEQKNKGVNIDIITNQNQGSTPDDEWVIINLKEQNIPVLSPKNDRYEQMHHKFFIFHKNIFNKRLLCTGSYNPTRNGDTRSWDDIIIIDNQDIIDAYIKRFEEIKAKSK